MSMIDFTAGHCPRCGGRLYVDIQYPDEIHCDTCNYPDLEDVDNIDELGSVDR